jgi:Right handed beta helix region/Domain of unknown function (DUF5123)
MKKTLIFTSACLASLAFYACKSNPTQDDMAPTKENTTTFYVAPTGNDSHTIAQARNAATPWKTIQKAANSVPTGATVVIAGGTYPERITLPESCNGTAANPTVFRNKGGETVIIEGNNAGKIWEGLFNLKNNAFITLKGIKTQNFYWYGFNVNDSQNIVLDSCATYNTGASGIYVRLTTEMTITNSNVRKACQRPFREPNGNGTQEDISLVSVSKFKVSNNEVWDSTVPNTAGGEGIDAKGGSFDGEISNNYIHDIVPLGIYLDAGTKGSYDIRIFGNKLERTGGLGVAGELGGHAHEIYFYNNIVKDSRSSGIVFQDTGNGKFTNVYVVNNTFYNNAQTGFAGEVGSYTKNPENTNIVIRNNIFYNKNANARFSIWHNYAAGCVVSNNLYFDFKPSNNNANSFNEKNLTGADILKDPEFNNPSTGDFSLKPSSPAVNRAMPITLPNSTTLLFATDMKGKSRGAKDWDMGAQEN